MRHKCHWHSFGRKSGPRKALFKGLVVSLVEHGRIRTTLAKAKELRRHVERAVTLGRRGDLHATRLLMARYPNETAVRTIVNDIAPRFKDRPGGYTRIIKLGTRPGDNAEMAYIEFIDYKLPEKSTEETVKGDADKAKRAKASAKAQEQWRKTRRRMQVDARRVSRQMARNA